MSEPLRISTLDTFVLACPYIALLHRMQCGLGSRMCRSWAVQWCIQRNASAVLVLLQEAAAVTRSQVAQNGVQGHTVSVSLLSDSDDEHRPDSGHEMTSDPSVHVHLRVHQPASQEEQLRAQLRQQQQLAKALGGQVAQLEAELGAREAQRAALLGEVALLRAQAAKAEQRISVLETEVVALMQQAEQSSYEHALAQQVQPCYLVCAAVTCAMSLRLCRGARILLFAACASTSHQVDAQLSYEIHTL